MFCLGYLPIFLTILSLANRRDKTAWTRSLCDQFPSLKSRNILLNVRIFHRSYDTIKGRVCSSPANTQLQHRNGQNCDSLVLRLSSLISGTLRQSTKRCSNISPPGGCVISVFSAGNCNIYLEGKFVSFCLKPFFPFPLIHLFINGHLEENRVNWEGFGWFIKWFLKVLRGFSLKC